MKKKIVELLGFAFILSFMCASVQAKTLILNPKDSNFVLGEGIQFVEDKKGTLTLDDIRSLQDEWNINKDEIFSKGYNSSVWWLKFVITNENKNVDWLIEISYAVLDYVNVYVIDKAGLVTESNMGDKLLFSTRPIEHRYFTVPLPILQSESVTVYVRVKSTSSVQVPITVWDRKAFSSSDIGRTALHGFYYGGLVVIALYNLLIYFVLRERIYLYYVGYVSAMFIFMASLNGWAFQFFWPDSNNWNDTAILISLDLVVLFGLLFTQRFLGFNTPSRSLSISAKIILVISVVLLFVFMIIPYSIGIHIIILFAVFGCSWALFSGIYAWKKGHESAAIYVVAWSSLLVGGVILALSKFHIFPRNVFTDYATQVGSLLEVLLLSFALAERINKEKILRFAAQKEALTIQQQANEELEHRVASRTRELEYANNKLQELSNTDQLTGLKNRRFLNQYIEREIARGVRFKHEVAVMLIDIDHFKSVNDSHGHLVGDNCLKVVAKRICNQMRWPTDLAARYGGEEFCVILPETELDGAVTVAERIRQNVNAHLVEVGEVELELSVSIGVYASVPSSVENRDKFLALADKALYLAKANGRNRIELANE